MFHPIFVYLCHTYVLYLPRRVIITEKQTHGTRQGSFGNYECDMFIFKTRIYMNWTYVTLPTVQEYYSYTKILGRLGECLPVCRMFPYLSLRCCCWFLTRFLECSLPLFKKNESIKSIVWRDIQTTRARVCDRCVTTEIVSESGLLSRARFQNQRKTISCLTVQYSSVGIWPALDLSVVKLRARRGHVDPTWLLLLPSSFHTAGTISRSRSNRLGPRSTSVFSLALQARLDYDETVTRLWLD